MNILQGTGEREGPHHSNFKISSYFAANSIHTQQPGQCLFHATLVLSEQPVPWAGSPQLPGCFLMALQLEFPLWL